MNTFMLSITIALSVVIVILTLFQGKGGGLGSAWGNVGGGFQTKRGLEKVILRATAVLIGVFFIVSVINLIS